MMILTIMVGMAYEPTIKHIVESFLFLKLHWHRPILSVGWTLEFEFLFYMSIVVVLLFAKKISNIFVYTSVLLFAGTILVDVIIYPQGAYGYFIEFWYGMVIYFLVKNVSILSKNFILMGIIAGFILGYFSMYMHDESNRAYLRFLTYGIPSFMIVFFSLIYEKFYVLKRLEWLLLLGNASFSIYLSHLITLHIYYKVLDISKHYSLLSDLVSIIISILIGIIVYLFVEKKMNQYIHKKILKRK